MNSGLYIMYTKNLNATNWMTKTAKNIFMPNHIHDNVNNLQQRWAQTSDGIAGTSAKRVSGSMRFHKNVRCDKCVPKLSVLQNYGWTG